MIEWSKRKIKTKIIIGTNMAVEGAEGVRRCFGEEESPVDHVDHVQNAEDQIQETGKESVG
jgi:hypothetical protein